MPECKQERTAALVVLFDHTTYEDPYDHKPVSCIIMVTERETGDDKWRLPRIPLPKRIIEAGPETMTEYTRTELATRIGFEINSSLTLTERLVESKRTFFVFAGVIVFTGATDNTYMSVRARSFADMQFYSEDVSPLHYAIGKRLLKKDV